MFKSEMEFDKSRILHFVRPDFITADEPVPKRKMRKRSAKTNWTIKVRKGNGRRRTKRTPRELTERRKERIIDFLKVVHCNPKRYGEMGSEAWIAGLIQSLEERRKRSKGVIASDVRLWLKTHREFFRSNWKDVRENMNRSSSKPGQASKHQGSAKAPAPESHHGIPQERPEPPMSNSRQGNRARADVDAAAATIAGPQRIPSTFFLQAGDRIIVPNPNRQIQSTNPVPGPSMIMHGTPNSPARRNDEPIGSFVIFKGNVTPQSLLVGTQVMAEYLQRLWDQGRTNYIDWQVCSQALKTVQMCLDKRAP